jgi:serine/threonine protein kinase
MPADDHMHMPSTLGPYRLQGRLGEGGMGVVHLAYDPEGRRVAVKVLRPLGTEGVNARRRLVREVEAMRRVRSPYVAEVLDADVMGEYPYIVTRFVAGPTLDDVVRTRGPLSGPWLQRLAYGMAEALAAIHAAGVAHRDLQPGNVMLTGKRPVVIDFGIAHIGGVVPLAQTGLDMGTSRYQAPEVIEGLRGSPASDVHSWGATMAFAATGRPPFGTGSSEAIFYRIASGRADLDGVPAPLVPLIFAALAREPARRPRAAWLSAQASALDLAPPGVAPGNADLRDPEPDAPAPDVLLPVSGPPAHAGGRNGLAAEVPPELPQLPRREDPRQYHEDLSRLAELERAAKEWDRETRHEDYLLRGDRLIKAQLAVEKSPEYLTKLPTANRKLMRDLLRQSAPASEPRVFLCHSSSDKPAVRRLYQQLRAVNVRSWLDERDILPGQDWELEILRAIRASQAIVVCLSEAAVNKRGYVQKEIKFALDISDEQPEGSIYLIPLRLEACEVPNRLRQYQWVDLFQQDGFEHLVRALRKLAEPGA